MEQGFPLYPLSHGNLWWKLRRNYPEHGSSGECTERCLLFIRTYMQSVVKLFDRIRTDIGWNLEIMHDIHEETFSGRYTEFYKRAGAV